MGFVTVDNDQARLAELSVMLQGAFPGCTVNEFTDPFLASKHVYSTPVDAALIEQAMRPADGFTLVGVLRRYKPALPIVMLSDSEAFRALSKQMRVDEYFVRPLTDAQLKQLKEYDTGQTTQSDSKKIFLLNMTEQ